MLFDRMFGLGAYKWPAYRTVSANADGSFARPRPSLIHPLMPPRVDWFAARDDNDSVRQDIRAARHSAAANLAPRA